MLDADSDVADRYREIDRLIAAGAVTGRTINRLILQSDAHVAGIDLNGVAEAPVPVLHLRESGQEVQGSDLFFRLVLPNDDLRAFVAFQLGRRVEEDPEAKLARDDVLELPVPANLDAVVAAIRSLTVDDLQARY